MQVERRQIGKWLSTFELGWVAFGWSAGAGRGALKQALETRLK